MKVGCLTDSTYLIVTACIHVCSPISYILACPSSETHCHWVSVVWKHPKRQNPGYVPDKCPLVCVCLALVDIFLSSCCSLYYSVSCCGYEVIRSQGCMQSLTLGPPITWLQNCSGISLQLPTWLASNWLVLEWSDHDRSNHKPSHKIFCRNLTYPNKSYFLHERV